MASVKVAVVVNRGRVQTAWVIERENLETMATIGGFAVDAAELDYLEFHVIDGPVYLGMDWPPRLVGEDETRKQG